MIKRLGIYSENKRRPILVEMDCRLDVSNVLINWKSLPKGINVSPDLTEYQRSLYKTLKDSAKLYNSQHQDDNSKQIVKMVRDNPKLITINNKRRNASRKTSESNSINESKNV